MYRSVMSQNIASRIAHARAITTREVLISVLEMSSSRDAPILAVGQMYWEGSVNSYQPCVSTYTCGLYTANRSTKRQKKRSIHVQQ